MKNVPPRRDRAIRFASAIQLATITYAIAVRAIARSAAARSTVDKLSARASRVLSVLAAVHRSGRLGYRGVEAPYDALAGVVRRATAEPCSRSTLERAIRELVKAGLIALSWGSELTERTESGAFRPRAIEIAPGRWIAARVRVIALTPAAIALWSWSSNGGGQPSKTTSKCRASESQRQGSKEPLVIDKGQNELSRSTGPGAGDYEESPCGDSSTRGPAEPVHVEHEIESRPETPPLPDKQFVTTHKQPRPINGRSDNAARETGPTVTPPPTLPRVAPPTWKNNRLRLLRDLFLFLRNFSNREADMLFARARLETRSDFPRNLEPAIDWDYFVMRWDRFSRSARYHFLRRTLLPALRAAQRQPKDTPPAELSPPADTPRAAVTCASNSVMDAVRQALEATIETADDPISAAKMKKWRKLF